MQASLILLWLLKYLRCKKFHLKQLLDHQYFETKVYDSIWKEHKRLMKVSPKNIFSLKENTTQLTLSSLCVLCCWCRHSKNRKDWSRWAAARTAYSASLFGRHHQIIWSRLENKRRQHINITFSSHAAAYLGRLSISLPDTFKKGRSVNVKNLGS